MPDADTTPYPRPPARDDGSAFATESARRAAVAARDRRADGAFVFSVRTTGVYCRPSCAARAARPENIAFHATCAAAQDAGFRPCLRCRPNGPSREERRSAAVALACRLIEQAETPPPLAALAQAAGMSRFHFHRVFKGATGVTPKAYAAARRSKRVADGLREGASVTRAVFAAGFNASSRFYEEAQGRLGMSPRAYRAGGAGAAIRFALGQCSLGAVLVAATDKGVCAILLGDDPAALLRDLEDRFPQAELTGGDLRFEALVAQVVGCVEAPGRGFDLPLDIGGTAFQQRVWEALRKIPAGTTATYTQVARALGEPAAVRAVARACGANALAVAIPCHRVVRADGSLSGYRWGIERKRDLLAREGVVR